MKTFLKKISGFAIGSLLTAVLGLVIVPITTRFISPEEYGRSSMFVLAQGLVSMIIYLGIDQAYAREYNQAQDKRQLLLNAIMMPLVVSLIFSVVLVLFSGQVSVWLFDVPTEQIAVGAMAFMFPFMVIKSFAMLKIRMDEKGLLYSACSVALKLLVLIFTLAMFLVYEKSFRSVVYALALAEIVEGAVLYLTVIHPLRPQQIKIDKAVMTRMLRFGLPLLPANLLSWVLTSLDQVMLRTLCDFSQLGLYAAANKIVSILNIVQTCFTTIWVPVYFRWYEEKVGVDRFETVMKFVALFMSAMCFGVLLCKDILAWILGESFAKAIAIFPFLLLHPIMYTMSETTTLGIAFSRKTWYNILVTSVSAAVNIAMNYMLIPILGGVGAAMATGVSYVVFFWMRTLISRRLWNKFNVGHFVVCTVLVLVNCLAHSFLDGAAPYALSGICLVLIVCKGLPLVNKAVTMINLSH